MFCLKLHHSVPEVTAAAFFIKTNCKIKYVLIKYQEIWETETVAQMYPAENHTLSKRHYFSWKVWLSKKYHYRVWSVLHKRLWLCWCICLCSVIPVYNQYTENTPADWTLTADMVLLYEITICCVETAFSEYSRQHDHSELMLYVSA